MRLKIASLLGLLSKTQGFNPDSIVDDAIGTLNSESKTTPNSQTRIHAGGHRTTRRCLSIDCLHVCGLFLLPESHQVLAQLLDTLLVIGTQLPDNPAVRQRLIEVACKVRRT